MIFFYMLAITGFCISVVVHFSTYLPDHPVGISQAWPLHIGIFVVFLPMLLLQKRNVQRASSATGPEASSKQKSFKDQFPLAPTWMHRLLGLCFGYAIVNFALFMFYATTYSREGQIRERDGRYVMEKHGQVTRQASEAEYRDYEARVARGASGHWMIFYAASAVGLYDGIARRRRDATLLALKTSPAPREQVALPAYAGRSPRLGLRAHSIVAKLIEAIGFFGGPICVVLLFFPWLHSGRGFPGFNCCFVPLFFGSAVAGVAISGMWFQSSIAARCPSCGGRASGTERGRSQGRGWDYRCKDCGLVHYLP